MDIFYLSERIRFLPVIHGSANFTRIVREHILSTPTDCVAVALPKEFQTAVEDGIKLLPVISLCNQTEPEGKVNYVPIDPCQPMIMGLRIAAQEGIVQKQGRCPTFPNESGRQVRVKETMSTAQLPQAPD